MVDPIPLTPPPPTNSILSLVEKFNSEVREIIEGPNCTDPAICHGDCCFVNLDVPKVLVDHYVQNLWALTSDFERGSHFSFRVKMDLETFRCPFFDSKINGCAVHFTGMKIPQCWVYPTGLDPTDDEPDCCKQACGWKIIDPEKAQQANEILEQFVSASLLEAKKANSPVQIHHRLMEGDISNEIVQHSPWEIAGVKDGWDFFTVLLGEGYNLGLRSFCNQIDCSKEYFECRQVCPPLRDLALNFLTARLPTFISEHGFKSTYTFFELKTAGRM